MDTSERYIKMCDCLEVGEQIKDDRCSFWARPLITGKYSVWKSFHSPGDIWLPRQDQIQEMVRKHKAQEMGSKRPHDEWFPKGDIGLGYVFNGFIKFASDYMREIYNSFEQLWLAFYIYEKHNKIWDGKKWRGK